ncbi:MAG TPA: hypothetical protein ENN75_03910 [candidate division Zixibacteria bacterium]|nr:hypothetical protein [candidate division Zixibacteria bacterium]
MTRYYSILCGIILIATSAMAIDPPNEELLLRFLRERLTPNAIWTADSRCTIISAQDTTIANGTDTLDCATSRCDYAKNISPFAPNLELLTFPLTLAETAFDSIRVNKTRTRIEGIMCWKFRIFIPSTSSGQDGGEIISCYMTGDGFFRVMKMERKGRGKSKSDDIWEFAEVRRGKDLPCKITRTVEFEWGGEAVNIVVVRELSGFSGLSEDAPSSQ